MSVAIHTVPFHHSKKNSTFSHRCLEHRRNACWAARLLGEVANKDAAGPIAEFLPKMIEAGRESPELTARGNLTREEIYALSVRTVLQALAKLDAELARKRARNILLNGPQPLKPAALEVWSESE